MSKPIHADDGGRFSGRHSGATASAAVLVLSFFFLAAFPVDAGAIQWNAIVRGQVTDVDGNPLENVKVTCEPLFQNPDRPVAPIVVESSEEGEYQARNVRLGDTIITFELEGYQPLQVQRPLRAGPVRVNVTLEAVAVSEAVVSANIANDAYQAGREAFAAGDYAAVVSQMQEVAEVMESTPEITDDESLGYVYALMGRAYLEQRMFDEAADAYRKWVEYHPDDTAPLVELAQALSESGDQEAASVYFEAALALGGGDAMTHYNMGIIMINSGNLDGGVPHLEAAIEMQPVYPLAYQNLGYAYARREEYAKAIEAFEKYIEQSPDADDVAQIADFIAALKEMIGGETGKPAPPESRRPRP